MSENEKQTYEQLKAERDLLFLSQKALLAKLEKVKKISDSRLQRLRKEKFMRSLDSRFDF